MANKYDPIGVFDSGVGGISVLRELIKQLPREDFLYFGDSANAPYGEKTPQQVQQLTLQAAEYFLSRKVKAIVVACNTATAAAIRELRCRYPDTIIVGIEPALKLAATRFPTGNIGIMATRVTLGEEKLSQLLEQFPQAHTVRIPAPGLVRLIEQGKTDDPETQALLEQVLAPYAGRLDALVLGCTHYPFVKDTISRILGENTLLFDGGAGTARHTRQLLEEKDLLNPNGGLVTIENSLPDPTVHTLCQRLLTACIPGEAVVK